MNDFCFKLLSSKGFDTGVGDNGSGFGDNGDNGVNGVNDGVNGGASNGVGANDDGVNDIVTGVDIGESVIG